MSKLLIQSQKETKEALKKLNEAKIFGLDLEFFRKDTYFAKLCLIQIGYNNEAFIFDSLADPKISELVFDFLLKSKAIKVIHSSSQDLEIIYQLSGKVLTNVADCQLLANFCGFEFQISYAKLVKLLFSDNLNKKLQSCDWKKRPLTDQQLNYLAKDVAYLTKIYDILAKKLEKSKNLNWFNQEMKTRLDLANFVENEDLAWKKVRLSHKSSTNFNMLKALAKFRLRKAIELDQPIRWVLSDKLIMELSNSRKFADTSNHKSFDESDLRRNNVFASEIKNNSALVEELLDVINSVKEYSKVPHDEKNHQVSEEVILFCKLLMINLAKERGICSPLVANESEIIKFLEKDESSLLFNTWRKEFFGKELALALRGRKSLKISNAQLTYSNKN